MNYKIQSTDLFDEDLEKTADYIAYVLCNPLASIRLTNSVEHKYKLLSANPYINSIVRDPFLAAYGIRMQIIRHYLMFYIIDDNTHTIYILRFLYARRNWIKILKNDLESQSYQEIMKND